MKTRTNAFPLAFAALLLAACGGGSGGPSVDSTKTTAEVQADAQQADANSLRASVSKYQEAIAAEQSQLDAVLAQIKALEPGEVLGGKGAELKKETDVSRDRLADLQAKLQIYVKELAKKNAGP